MSDLSARLARLERGILAAIKETSQNIPEELSIEILDQMDFTTPGKSKSGARVLPKNSGSRLRTLYGNLTRALQPGGKGNISKSEFKQGKYTLEFGFDPTTKVTQGNRQGDLRYGVLHEYGGTIPHPGGTPYIVVEGGKAVFVSIGKAQEIEAKTGRKLPVTKPHSITMKARPFLRPGLRQFETSPNGLPALLRELETDIVDVFYQEFG
jgi:hypothetical protein